MRSTTIGDRRPTSLLRSCALALAIGTSPVAAIAQDDARQQQATATVTATRPATGLLPEPRIIGKTVDFVGKIGDGHAARDGFYLDLSNMITGAGWISAGPGYRRHLLDGRALVDASAAMSWRSYKMAQARVELPTLANNRLVIGSQIRWQDLTQVTYFGDGPDAPEADRSEYRMRSTNVVGYATAQPNRWLSISGRLGWVGRPAIQDPSGSFERGNPSARAMFGTDPVFTLPEQPTFAYTEASVVADTRDHRAHPTNGGLYRVSWSSYADRDAGPFAFARYDLEGAHFVPLADARVVIAMRGWLVGSDTADGKTIPFYFLPSLGGSNTIRAYTDYRFHDRNLLVFNAESRVAMFTHLDAVLFVDAGNVAARVGDLNFDKRAYGVGFRVHSDRTTFMRFDMAHGAEGWRFLLRMNDPLHLRRLSKRTAPLPFVP